MHFALRRSLRLWGMVCALGVAQAPSVGAQPESLTPANPPVVAASTPAVDAAAPPGRPPLLAEGESQPLLRRLPPVSDVAPASHQLLVPQANFPPDDDGTLLGSDPRLSTLWQERQKQLDKAAATHGKPSYQIGGQVQADTVYFGQDAVSRASVGDLQDAADFRRARLVLQG